MKLPGSVLLLLLFFNESFAQPSTSDAAFQRYFSQLNQLKVDTILVHRWGCVGCDRIYDSSSTSTATGEIIYVLTTHQGISAIATFDHYSERHDTVDVRKVFRAIRKYRTMLIAQQASKRYTHKSELKGSARKLPFMFEVLECYLPGTKFRTEFIFDANHRLEGATSKTKIQLNVTRKIVDIYLRCLPILPVE